MAIQFWFEFASTYSYPAAMRIESAAAARGIRVEWKPFLLGPIFRGQGWNDSPFNLVPVKGAYMWRDLARDQDISTPAVIARCLESAGQAPAPVLEAAGSEASKAKLRAQGEEAERRGIFGAPSFWVGDELFWGNDRLEAALAWHAARQAGQP